MPNCKSFLVTEVEWKHVRRRARFQQHLDISCHQFSFFSCKARLFFIKFVTKFIQSGYAQLSELFNFLISVKTEWRAHEELRCSTGAT